MRRLLSAAACCVLGLTSSVLAWNAHGHRTITYLALEGLPSDMPSWLREQITRDRIADEANEPDRWRGMPIPAISHETYPEHYLDIEDLAQYGLTLETVSPFRYEYVRDIAVALYVHPEMAKPYSAAEDPDKTKRIPGFLPHAIIEHYQKLRISFNTVRILESLNDPDRASQLQTARENCIHEMGLLSHYVGDAAQPLHTTKHHHGWVGDNPHGYTTKKEFHAYIDGNILDIHKLTVDSLRAGMKYDVKINAADPWQDAITYIKRSFDAVEPLYELEKSGDLVKDKGKDFISGRLRDAGSTLSALYAAAWESAKPDEREIQSWVKYNNFKPDLLPKYTTDGAPASTEPAKSPK